MVAFANSSGGRIFLGVSGDSMVTSSPLQVTGLPASLRLLMQPSPQALIPRSPRVHIGF
ncbi:MAG: hypothetical protein U9N09_02620 [Euryarchaeota archaeon]|nr:hypothetical protein [Euryarchaeota archaeon]